MSVKHVNSPRGAVQALTYYWSVSLLAWTEGTQPSAGGGGGASTIADGADVAEGAKADSSWSGSGSGSIISILKRIASAIKAGNTVASTIDNVVMLGAKQTDAPALDFGSFDGANKTLVTDQLGYLRVTLGQSSEPNPVRDDADIKDNDAYAPGTSFATVVGGEVDETSPASLSEGRAGAVRMSPNRNLYGVVRDAAGNERGANVTASNALKVDGSAVTQPVTVQDNPYYSMEFDYAGGPTLIYIGSAAPGTATSAASWLVRQVTYDGSNNITSFLYANGSRSFNQIWNNRASLSYS